MDEVSNRRWVAALDLLQLQADQAIASCGSDVSTQGSHVPATAQEILAWAPPPDLGEIPEELMERAQTVLELQKRAATLLAASQAVVEAEIGDLVPPPRAQVRPLYVDVIG